MEQQSQDDSLRIVEERVSRRVSTSLHDLGVDRERSEYLSDYRNVLRDLPNATEEDWDLVAAVITHIIVSNSYGNDIDVVKLREVSREHIEGFMYDTYNERPKVLLLIDLDTGLTFHLNKVDVEQLKEENLENVEHLMHVPFRERPRDLLRGLRMPKVYKAQPRLGTYIYSRLAMAMLAVDEDPQYVIRLYEDVLGMIDVFGTTDILMGSLSLVRNPLGKTYESVERYEDALNLSIPSTPGTVWVRGPNGNDEDNARRFIGWMIQLLGSGAIADVKRFLDKIYVLLKSVEGIDNEGRDLLSECPKDTRQYWAWFYGYALGKLLVERPDLRSSLLHELDAGEWSEGWHAGGVIFDIPGDSWDKYRGWAWKFYHEADIEHRVGQYINDYTNRTSSGDRQPPHLSAQSDLYWAMRVGFADAHIESGGDGKTSLQEIVETLNQVREIASSSALRTLGVEAKLDQVSEEISRGLPPTEEHWREMLRQLLGSVYGVLSERTIQHLTKALDRRHAKDPDAQRIAIAQAVESLFHEMVIPGVQRSGEGAIMVSIQERGNTKREYPLDGKRTLQMSEWAQILDHMRRSKEDDAFTLGLSKAFPKVDIQALSRLTGDLRKMSEFRGRASHHSRDYSEWKAEKASEFWGIVIGGEESTGFLENFCVALGLVERETNQHGKG